MSLAKLIDLQEERAARGLPGHTLRRRSSGFQIRDRTPRGSMQQRWFKGTDSNFGVFQANAEHLSHPQLISLSDMDQLRGRCRWIMASKPLARSIEVNYQTGLVGEHGPQLEVQIPDRTLRSQVARAWTSWSNEAQIFDYRGEDCLTTMLSVAISTLLTDGDIFMRFRPGLHGQPLRMELIDPARVPIRATHHSFDISMGVEVDPAGRPEAYFINPLRFGYKSTSSYYGTIEAERVPADSILHFSIRHHIDQLRGVPLLAVVLVNMHVADEFISSVLQNALLTSNHWLAVQEGDEDDQTLFAPQSSRTEEIMEGEEEEETTVEVQTIYNDRVGIVTVGQGSTISALPKNFPDSATAPFVEATGKQMAAGSGVPMHALMHDYSKVNYSSSKVADVLFRANMGRIHKGLQTAIYSKIYRRWLREMILHRQIDVPAEMMADPALYRHKFYLEKPRSVDPHRDAQTNTTDLQNGTTSRIRILRERGIDPEEFAEELAYEKELLGEQAPPPSPQKPPAAAAAESDEDEESGTMPSADGETGEGEETD